MNKATPSVRISDLDREDVTSAESAPSAESDFVNFWTSHIDGRGGGPLSPSSRIYTAKLPLWNRYEKGRFRWGLTVNSGTLTDLTVGVWGWTPEEVAVFLGEESLNDDDKTINPFEFDIESGMIYAVRITTITGTSPDVSLAVSAQAYNTYLNLA